MALQRICADDNTKVYLGVAHTLVVPDSNWKTRQVWGMNLLLSKECFCLPWPTSTVLSGTFGWQKIQRSNVLYFVAQNFTTPFGAPSWNHDKNTKRRYYVCSSGQKAGWVVVGRLLLFFGPSSIPTIFFGHLARSLGSALTLGQNVFFGFFCYLAFLMNFSAIQ